MTVEDSSAFAEPVRNSLLLRSGRRLAYYIFPAKDPSTAYPVLFMHGYPGSGLGGSVCAREVALAGGQLYSVDRPGVGYTDPLPNAGYSFEACCSDIWELIETLGWIRFSVTGLSGGGPHLMALVASYLERREQNLSTVVLERAVIVGGICCSAGTEGMMPLYLKMYSIARDYHKSWWPKFQALCITAIAYILFHFLPPFLINIAVPSRDKKLLTDNENHVKLMVIKGRTALRQGPAGTIGEGLRCFGINHGWEKTLLKHYGSVMKDLPLIHILHGGQDNIAPLSHAYYVHEKLFAERSTLHIYADLGHVSLGTEQVQSYVKLLVKVHT